MITWQTQPIRLLSRLNYLKKLCLVINTLFSNKSIQYCPYKNDIVYLFAITVPETAKCYFWEIQTLPHRRFDRHRSNVLFNPFFRLKEAL